ncbi:MAG: Unknown protein [uncultured Sulfurovum sp.]|uniref:Prokaryotic metallothionein family protein n=1 Tax=uncultured Sulfurovum sp. TaxID=269237 RepID=A0A6S6SCA7_9BACT|nr:MAG: Unknown protein [uncultured Sulfurovum sp.]
MWLKVIFIGIILVFIYRLVGGKIPFIDKPEAPKEGEHDFGKIEATSECATCGTYITEADAIIYQKKSYCSNDCLEKSK